jgi:SAM-dependent methyltransferase
MFAALYDPMMAATEKAGPADQRRELLEQARGRVLEIGGGTGANLPYYGASVDEVVFIEPEESMARRLERKLTNSNLRARVVRAPAEALPFEDASFDVVVSTLVLCTVSDQPRALAEIHRVLKPDGRLLFVEHVRSDDAKLARWQDSSTVSIAGSDTGVTAIATRSRASPAPVSRSWMSSTTASRKRRLWRDLWCSASHSAPGLSGGSLASSSELRHPLLEEPPLGIGVNELERLFVGGASIRDAIETAQ